MAALSNTTTAADVTTALDIEMTVNFTNELNKLTEILGIFEPEVVSAGTAMYQYKVTGSLNDSEVAEGDEVPLTKYTLKKTAIGEIELKPYRKLTTAQAILKSGYNNAVLRTDNKMIRDVRSGIVSDFFTFLGNGTATATGSTLKAVLAQADAKVRDEIEKNSDETENVVFFVNRFDIADYLANAEVTTQTVFGMTYIKDFLGVQNIFVTSSVPEGTVYATPVENIHLYGIDFEALGDAGLDYTVQDGSLIGVKHSPAFDRTSAETYVLSGCLMIPEATNYICKATIAPAV